MPAARARSSRTGSEGEKPGAAPDQPRGCLDQPRRDRPADRIVPELDLVFIEPGGDDLAATFSPELADLTIYAIDAAGDKISPKAAPASRARTCS
jgi:hypothetical protein